MSFRKDIRNSVCDDDIFENLSPSNVKLVLYYKKKLNEKDRIIIAQQKKIESLEDELKAIKQELKTAMDTIALLNAQIKRDSMNSSKPPSSDGLKKRRRANLREKSGRPTGGQKGHKGETLKMVDNPDRIVRHKVSVCGCCNASLDWALADRIEVRQVFDVPAVRMEVTEHQAEVKTCPFCRKTTKASFEAGVDAPTQYGKNIKSQITYMSIYQMVSYERIADYFKDLYNWTISEGTLRNVLAQAENGLCGFEEAVKNEIRNAPVVHADETPVKVNKKDNYIFVVSTDKLTSYFAHPARTKIALELMGILTYFVGILVSDCWSSYLSLGCAHALCNVHILREMKGLIELEPDCPCWVKKMQMFLLSIKKMVEARQKTGSSFTSQELSDISSRYVSILEEGRKEYPAAVKGKKRKKSDSERLLNRLAKHRAGFLAFAYNFDVPFDNNQAERDLRMCKTKQKVSGCFRSFAGLANFCKIRSYISTVRKNNVNVQNALKNLFCGKPWMPKSKVAEQFGNVILKKCIKFR